MLIRTVEVINLSQFLRATLTISSWHITFQSSAKFVSSGSGQIRLPWQLYLSPGFAKIAPWWLARRDYFLAIVPGLVSADGATNVYFRNRRAVMLKPQRVTGQIRLDWKGLSITAQSRIIFVILDNFIFTIDSYRDKFHLSRQILHLYQDSSISTTFS